MRIKDLTQPLYEMAAFNWARSNDRVAVFFGTRRGYKPSTIVFPLDDTLHEAEHFLIVYVRPKVAATKNSQIIAKNARGIAISQQENLFQKLWEDLIPEVGYGGEVPFLQFAQQGILDVYPEVFKLQEVPSKAKLYHILTTQGLQPSAFEQQFGPVKHGLADTHGDKVKNATVFFPPAMRPNRKKMMVQFLITAHDFLASNGLGDLFSGNITFTQLPGKTIGDWHQPSMQMRIQPNTQNDKTNIFTLLHEYGHKFWYNMMSEEQRAAVRTKFWELRKSGVKHEATDAVLNQMRDVAAQVIKPGVQVEWIGRKTNKLRGRWEVTKVEDRLVKERFKVYVEKYYQAKQLPEKNEFVVKPSTMSGPIISLLNKKRWKFLNIDDSNLPDLNEANIIKSDLVSDDWFPTKYSETEATEWFPELFGMLMLGNLKGEPAEFMKQVMGR